jgi:hypothetical protein
MFYPAYLQAHDILIYAHHYFLKVQALMMHKIHLGQVRCIHTLAQMHTQLAD